MYYNIVSSVANMVYRSHIYKVELFFGNNLINKILFVSLRDARDKR